MSVGRRAVLGMAGWASVAATIGMPASARADIGALRMMIGANPGGGYDQTGRAIGASMIAAGQAKSATYENRGGAGGTIALAQFVNSEKGNPAALLVTGTVMVGAIEASKPPVTLKDATPVARLYADTMVIVVSSRSPIKTLADLLTRIKDHPGQASWGGGSKGSPDHILAGLVTQAAGIDAARTNYIPFAGGGEASSAILGGQVTVGIAGVSEFLPFIQSGKMRVIGVSSGERVRDLPTLKEQGTDVEIYNWRGVYGPPGLSAAQSAALIESVVKATQHPTWAEALARNEWTPFLATGDAFGRYVDQEATRIGGMLKQLGVTR